MLAITLAVPPLSCLPVSATMGGDGPAALSSPMALLRSPWLDSSREGRPYASSKASSRSLSEPDMSSWCCPRAAPALRYAGCPLPNDGGTTRALPLREARGGPDWSTVVSSSSMRPPNPDPWSANLNLALGRILGPDPGNDPITAGRSACDSVPKLCLLPCIYTLFRGSVPGADVVAAWLEEDAEEEDAEEEDAPAVPGTYLPNGACNPASAACWMLGEAPLYGMEACPMGESPSLANGDEAWPLPPRIPPPLEWEGMMPPISRMGT